MMVKETLGGNLTGGSPLNINRKVDSWRTKRESSRVPNTKLGKTWIETVH